MSNSKKYFIKTSGLNEFSLNPDYKDDGINQEVEPNSEPTPDPASPPDIKGPIVIGTPSVAASVKGNPSGGLPSKSALGGYEPVKNDKNNSELINKTPINNDITDESNLKDDAPPTDNDEHPHQIQTGNVDATDSVDATETSVKKTEVDVSHVTEPPQESSVEASGEVSIEINETSNPLNKKINRLKQLKEHYSRKRFLTMKEVMLLNEANKLLVRASSE